MHSTNQAYRAITNDAGKVPATWKEIEIVFLIRRVAYIIFQFKIPKELCTNMDETPLMHTASNGHTWAETNSDNVSIQGGLDKRQHTRTPWINAVGDILFFHVKTKGKTAACLPKAEFRNQQQFTGGGGDTKMMFGYSDNHWVNKATMRVQVTEAEEYRKRMILRLGLEDDQKMLIIWDVYCRHKDKCLREWMKTTFPHIIVLYVPANLTEMLQALDVYFNAVFKTTLSHLRNKRDANE